MALDALRDEVMLTAEVHVLNNKRQPVLCRAVLDTASTANLISDRLAASLRLPMRRCSVPVGAVDNLSTSSKNIITLTLRSRRENFEKTLDFLTIPRISDLIPSDYISREGIPIPPNIELADPFFHKPQQVDLLLAAGPTLSLFCLGQIDLSQQGNDFFLQKTRFGWVMGGGMNYRTKQQKVKCHFVDLHDEMTKLWQIEEGPPPIHYSQEERDCEDHFVRHVTRDSTGRYSVALPFRSNHEMLGESRSGALKRLNALERRFHGNPELRESLNNGFQEYLSLGHMSPVLDDEDTAFVLPYQPVIKESSLTTKVRWVFDASAKSSTGVSLNDVLMVGPTIQGDIFSHLIRFRSHKYVLTGDIEKMYRQFLIRKVDRKYLRILRKEADGIKTYELNTVTFGLGPAPFLAIRTLHQLADDEENEFLAACKTLKRDLKRLIADLPESNKNLTLQLGDDQTLKTLGVFWNSKGDLIRYAAKPLCAEKATSKRTILSEIAKIFDPLGLLGPITLYAKTLMQKLWQLKLDWDESVPSHICSLWSQFCIQFDLVNSISFHRHVLFADATNIQLHRFSDASKSGYGACIYLRSAKDHGKIQSRLLCAKSRVTPLKTISIPGLELCGAQLLAKLYSSVVQNLEIKIDKTIFWTDSTIVLSWLKSSPHTLKTFVANRVAKIQEITKSEAWRHVGSKDNPADALSREQLPGEFIENHLWECGPSWLIKDETSWPKSLMDPLNEIPETKKAVCLNNKIIDDGILYRFSSFTKLKRVLAYCLRFKINNNNKGLLTVQELAISERVIIKLTQGSTFVKEIRDLTGGSGVHRKSKLNSLSPFIDENGLIRVGGRLKNSGLPYDQQHPILLPKSHRITDLIIEDMHLRNHHAGIQTTLYASRLHFWIIDGRNQIRKIIRKCVKCSRINPSSVDYVMGDLPKDRTMKARPFYRVGVDYCGPFFIEEKKYRNRNQIKVYVAVFVCLVIKAVHLKVVEDMTTEAFLGALRRFIARRGKPRLIQSDNGTNFVGANNELKEIYNFIETQALQEAVTEFCSEKNIEWKFIPPLSPHFGGIWEAAVKSFKHHLKRVTGIDLFTFIEFYTLVVEIEAILNSRPLTPISSDPQDILVLTPGHYLIGSPLTSLPEVDHTATPSNRLSLWQHIQKVRRDFWTRWYKEYLTELNIRHKWTKGVHDIKEGTIVVLREDNLPPLHWKLGRVVKTHPGSDGIIRTVTVRTANSKLLRNVKRLSPLPIDQNDK